MTGAPRSSSGPHAIQIVGDEKLAYVGEPTLAPVSARIDAGGTQAVAARPTARQRAPGGGQIVLPAGVYTLTIAATDFEERRGSTETSTSMTI